MTSYGGTAQAKDKGYHKESKSESAPLLKSDSSGFCEGDGDGDGDGEGGYFSALRGSGSGAGSSRMAHMNVAQYGLKLAKKFTNRKGDISGYVATDDCKLYIICVILGIFTLHLY
jgi:hypothetical protein